MTATTFFFIFIPLLAFILLAVNLIFAPHNPYQEKDSAFECGFHSFLGQNRTQFSISFFIFALLFLLFDLEILLVYPYIVSAYANGIYGLIVMLIFFLVLTLGFAFELGKNALKIDSRQMYSVWNKGTNVITHIHEKQIFGLDNLSYKQVFALSCRTFKDNLTIKTICTNLVFRLVLSGIICYLVVYNGWSLVELLLVRILISKPIIVIIFIYFNDRIVIFINNCTRKLLVFCTTYLIINFVFYLALFLFFYYITSNLLFAILWLGPELFGSILRMDINRLLNPTTPPTFPNNTGGSSGGGNGGGGSEVNSTLPAADHNRDNNSSDNHQGLWYLFLNYAPTPLTGNFNGNARQPLYFFNRKIQAMDVLYKDIYHSTPLDVFYLRYTRWHDHLRVYSHVMTLLPRYIQVDPNILDNLLVERCPGGELVKYDPCSREHCAKQIYELTPNGIIKTPCWTNGITPVKLQTNTYNKWQWPP